VVEDCRNATSLVARLMDVLDDALVSRHRKVSDVEKVVAHAVALSAYELRRSVRLGVTVPSVPKVAVEEDLLKAALLELLLSWQRATLEPSRDVALSASVEGAQVVIRVAGELPEGAPARMRLPGLTVALGAVGAALERSVKGPVVQWTLRLPVAP
jgi:hypothetical protein